MVEYDFRAAYAFLHSGVSILASYAISLKQCLLFGAYSFARWTYFNYLNFDEYLTFEVFSLEPMVSARGPASASGEAVTPDCYIYIVFPPQWGVLPARAGRTAVKCLDSKQ